MSIEELARKRIIKNISGFLNKLFHSSFSICIFNWLKSYELIRKRNWDPIVEFEFQIFVLFCKKNKCDEIIEA
jgi:hypothetical protein